MAFDLSALLRPHIATLQPYTSARDEYMGKEGIFLDANENPFGSATETTLSRYPDPYQWDIKNSLAQLKKVNPTQIFLGNGSDEAIDLLFRVTCTPGKDKVILLPPTYGMYEVSAGINNVSVQKISLTPDFQLDVPAILAAITAETKLICICSPNNPSGNKMIREDVYEILDKFPGIVLIDEAYIDFNDEQSFTEDLSRFPNLIVIQTFSKAWGLASLRMGMAFASEELIRVLNLVKPPYNISGLTQSHVLEALQHVGKVEEMVRQILNERTRLREKLNALPFVDRVFPSQANFLLVKIPKAKSFYNQLIERKIIVRNRSNVQLCENCLRITIGTPKENHALLQALEAIHSNMS